MLKIGNNRLFQTYKNQKISKVQQNYEDEDKYYVSIFSFSWNNNNIKLVNGDTIVIAPILTDYLDLNIDKEYMIYPF
jgi:ABC-type Fe3+ transport system substrate-binding protein